MKLILLGGNKMRIFNFILNISNLIFLLIIIVFGFFWLQGYYYFYKFLTVAAFFLFVGCAFCFVFYDKDKKLKKENAELKEQISTLNFQLSVLNNSQYSEENEDLGRVFPPDRKN